MLGQSEQHQGPENTAGSGGSRAESGKQSRALSALGLEPRAGPWPAGHSAAQVPGYVRPKCGVTPAARSTIAGDCRAVYYGKASPWPRPYAAGKLAPDHAGLGCWGAPWRGSRCHAAHRTL